MVNVSLNKAVGDAGMRCGGGVVPVFLLLSASMTSSSPRLDADGDGDLAEDEVATETIFG